MTMYEDDAEGPPTSWMPRQIKYGPLQMQGHLNLQRLDALSSDGIYSFVFLTAVIGDMLESVVSLCLVLVYVVLRIEAGHVKALNFTKALNTFKKHCLPLHD